MSTPSSNVNKLVDDLFSRPRQVAAAMSAAAAAPSQARGRASPLVDALFGSSDRTVMSTNSLRDNVLGALTHHGGAPGAAAGASASPARPTPSASVPKEAPGDMSQHLLFLVHGIGEHQDFQDDKMVSWDGSEGNVGGNFEFRQLLAAVASRRLCAAPLALAVASVEWHSALRAPTSDGHAAAVSEDAAADALLGACSPVGVSNLRSFTRDNVMDLLYYTSVPHAQLIVDTVLEQMRKRWETFVLERPGWDGSVHLFGHSLGSLIVLDMITHAGTTWHGVTYPQLPFPITHVFLAGSPAPLFLVARRQVVAVGSAEAAAAAPPAWLQCAGLFNFVNASDPIAHLYKPFLIYTPEGGGGASGGGGGSCGGGGGGGRDEGAPKLPEGTRLAIRSAATFKSLVEAQRSPPPPHELPNASKAVPSGSGVETVLEAVREAEATRATIDHHMTPTAAWTAVGAALNAPVAHASYWHSEEICLFMLLQMLVPWARAQQHTEGGEAGPVTPPRGGKAKPLKSTPSKLGSSATPTPASASPRTSSSQRPHESPATEEKTTHGGGGNASPRAVTSYTASPRVGAPAPSAAGGVSPLDLSLPVEAAGLMDLRCDVTARWSPAVVVLQRRVLYVIPAQPSELPRLVGSICLTASVASAAPATQPKKAGYFTLHAPHANASGPRAYHLYSPEGLPDVTRWAEAINVVSEQLEGRGSQRGGGAESNLFSSCGSSVGVSNQLTPRSTTSGARGTGGSEAGVDEAAGEEESAGEEGEEDADAAGHEGQAAGEEGAAGAGREKDEAGEGEEGAGEEGNGEEAGAVAAAPAAAEGEAPAAAVKGRAEAAAEGPGKAAEGRAEAAEGSAPQAAAAKGQGDERAGDTEEQDPAVSAPSAADAEGEAEARARAPAEETVGDSEQEPGPAPSAPSAADAEAVDKLLAQSAEAFSESDGDSGTSDDGREGGGTSQSEIETDAPAAQSEAPEGGAKAPEGHAKAADGEGAPAEARGGEGAAAREEGRHASDGAKPSDEGGEATPSGAEAAPADAGAAPSAAEAPERDATASGQVAEPKGEDAKPKAEEATAGGDESPSSDRAADAAHQGSSEHPPASAPAAAAQTTGVAPSAAAQPAPATASRTVSLRDDFLREMHAETASSAGVKGGIDADPGRPRVGSELRGLFGTRLSGMLQKRRKSSLSRWKSRWFALHGKTLLYFSREPQLARPTVAAEVSHATFRVHRPKAGDPPESVATTVSWALGGGRAVFLRTPPEGLKQWEVACEVLKLPIERNFAV